MRGPGGARGGMRGPMGRGDYGKSSAMAISITDTITTIATVTRATDNFFVRSSLMVTNALIRQMHKLFLI